MPPTNPEYVQKLSTLLVELGINQAELAMLAALDQSTISHYLTGRREPNKFSCLIFAGLAKSASDRDFWLNLAALDPRQRELLEKALVVTPDSVTDPYQREIVFAFLQFWDGPQNEVREKVKDLLQSMLFAHLPERNRS